MLTQPQQHPPRETRPLLQCRVFAALAQEQGSTFSLMRLRMTLLLAEMGSTRDLSLHSPVPRWATEQQGLSHIHGQKRWAQLPFLV